MSLLLNQLENEKMSSQPWPDDAMLYQPYEAEQILLPENASCLAVKAYLKMCKLPFEVKCCSNAEFMSPGGRMTKLPFLRAGAFTIAEFEPIVKFADGKSSELNLSMDEDSKADMRCYVSLADNIFTMAELYISFLDKEVYNQVTAPRNGCVFPWPLNSIQNSRKKRQALKLLKVYQWHDMTLDDVLSKVEKCCQTLTTKLEENDSPFFYDSEPCELDAIAFGHLFSILSIKMPNDALKKTIQKFDRLVQFCLHIDAIYFQSRPVFD